MAWLGGCSVSGPDSERDTTQSGARLSTESPAYDADSDGLGGVYDCDDDSIGLPAMCPLATPDPDRPVWCDDGLPVPASRSLMNWANQLAQAEGRDKGLREYLYDNGGRDQVPNDCSTALLATRGGPQDANTEQLTRYVIEGLGPTAVGYVLGGRSLWPYNADDWDYPNHAIDARCPSADGRTRLGDVQASCQTAIALRRTSNWDPCGSQYEGRAILIGGGQSASEYPKGNLIAALNRAIELGGLTSVDGVVDIDALHWSNACRTGFAARGCCHIANSMQPFSGKRGVQLVLPTNILGFGPICKNPDDLLRKYECSDLSENPDLMVVGDILREVLNQNGALGPLLDSGAGADDIIALGPLSEEALQTLISSGLPPTEIEKVLIANSPLSDRVLQHFLETIDNTGAIERVLLANSPSSVTTLLVLLEHVDNVGTLESLLLTNSPGVSETVLVRLLDVVDNQDLLLDVLGSNPGLSDTVLLSAITRMSRQSDITLLLLANCPLSPAVREAASEKLRPSEYRKLDACR